MSYVPAHFFLVTASELAYDCGFVGAQVFRVDYRNLFDGIGSPSPHDRIIDGKAGKQLRADEHLSDDLVGPADRPEITPLSLRKIEGVVISDGTGF